MKIRNRIFLGWIGWLLLCGAATAMAQQSNEPSTLQRAIDLFERRRWADARLELMQLQRQLPAENSLEQQQIAYYLALCAVEMKNPDAEQVLLRFEELHPGSLRTNDIRFALASYYCMEERFAEAEAAFQKIDYRSLDANNRTKYNMRRGYLAYAQGDYKGAYRYFKQVDKRSSYAEHATYYRAYIDYMEGNLPAAKKGFEQLVESENYHTTAPFYLLQLEFRQQHYTQVTSQGPKLLENLKGYQAEELCEMLAESWFHLGEYAHALDYIEQLRLAEGEIGRECSYIEGFSCYRLGRYSSSIEALRRVTGPKDALTQNAAYHLADCYLRTGDKRSAMQAFSMATDRQLNPTIAEDALYNYGKLQFELDEGLFNEAIHSLSRYLEEYPQSERRDEIHSLLAAAYYNSENYEAAYRAIHQLPAPDNELRAAQQKIAYFWGLKSYEAGQLNEAEKSLKESAAIAILPRYTSLASFWLGEIAFSKGNYPEAKKHFENYLARAPKEENEYGLALYNLGYCAMHQKQHSEAERYFTSFLARQSAADFRADALLRQGDCRYNLRHYADALTSYAEGRSLPLPARHYAAYRYALTLGILGRTDEKIEALKQIRTAQKGDYVDDATYELGESYLRRSQYQESATYLKAYVEEYPHAMHYTAALSDLGMVYANLGDHTQAMAYYNRVVTEAPTSSEARNAMQGIREIYLSKGDAEGYFAYAKAHGASGDLSDRMRDSLSFSAAQRLYLAQQHDDAARSLRSYIKTYPSGAYLTDALYYLGNCYLRLGDQDREFDCLKQLAAQGQNTYTPEVLERLAPIAYQRGAYELASDTYRRLMEIAPSESLLHSAMDGYVEATLATKDGDRIIAMATYIESEREVSAQSLRRARYAHATELRRRAKHREALEIFALLSRVEVRSAEGGEAMYRCIEHRFEQAQWKECEEMIFDFADAPAPNNYWLAKSYLLLGDLYLKQGDTFQARATWQSVADGYSPADDGMVEEALKRIANLKE